MNNKVILLFEKSLAGLAGYDFGAKTFQEQVKGKIDYNKDFEIVFPDNIERVASSFVQGFFEEIVQNIGITGVEEKVKISSSKDNMKQIIIKNLI